MLPRVAALTDTYLPTVNGVTYAVRAWREEYHDEGRMHVVYPDADRTGRRRPTELRSTTEFGTGAQSRRKTGVGHAADRPLEPYRSVV